MKTKLTIICGVIAVALCLGNTAESEAPKKGSPEFERMKTLVGTWKGTTDMGKGPIEMTVQYRLLAGGTVLEERVFPETPMEMVTMYYEKNGKLAMTHYCILGNRPSMTLKSSDETTLQFDFDPSCGINTKTEMHMHALTLRFDNADTITTECKSLANVQEQESKPCTLKRVKS